jgi:putative transposase
MPDFRRWYVAGGTYFFTVVTDQRAAFLCQPLARCLLSKVFHEAQERWPFEMPGFVLLPDHLHTIWTLPEGDIAYSRRWGWIKKEFTKRWLAAGGEEQIVTPGRTRDGRRGVWQPKFWEHTIRDETDFEHHINYIHFNPVKHCHVTRPIDWDWSSFHRWVRAGVYDSLWGTGDVEQCPDLNFDSIQDSVGE